METLVGLAPLLIILPFSGAFINMFFGRRLMPEASSRAPGVVAASASGASLFIALVLFIGLLASHGEGASTTLFTWFNIPLGDRTLIVDWAHQIDTLSIVMILVITGVGTLIHIFAIEYMHGDIDEQVNKRNLHGEEAYAFKARRYSRFFTYLGIFLGGMLILVTGDNYLMLFVGWEAVGLASFLLIGFWYDDPLASASNSNSAKKAFIANRVGDFGMLMAIMLTFWTFGSLNFNEVFLRLECMKTVSQSECLALGVAELEEEFSTSHGEDGEAYDEEALFPMVRSAGNALLLAGDEGEEVYTTPISLGTLEFNLTTMVTAICLFFLLGAAGKSAQIPLFVWLPDAMAGPTPVSALMHAATMVTAGIYLLTRSNEMLSISPIGAEWVAVIGGLTALVAATMAVAQYDIKRVLAFSTISQLGFMIAAVGLGGYIAGMFHLVTHAFFKALLFLGAGSVIHGIEHGHHHAAHGYHDDHGHDEHGHDDHHDEEHFDPQDMRIMGGLKDKMPITTAVYIIAALALAGIVPLSGFWSKDEILLDASNENTIVYIMLSVAAFFTAFYMGRQVFLVFFGKPRHEAAEYAVESSPVMTVPLIILAVGVVFGGLINLPFKGFHQFGHWLESSVRFAHIPVFSIGVAALSTVLAVAAIVVSYFIYGRDPIEEGEEDPLEKGATPIFNFLANRWYWDNLYHAIFIAPFIWLGDLLGNTIDWDFWHDFFHDTFLGGFFSGMSKILSKPVDQGIIDGLVNGIANVIGGSSSSLRRIQTGYVRNYALVIGLGVLVIIGFLTIRLLT